MKLPPGDPGRNGIVLRTNESILSDYSRFLADGGRLKRAKLFNNVINEPFFKDLPLTQVKVVTINVGEYLNMTTELHYRCALQDCTSLWVSSFGSSLCWRMNAMS